MAHLLQHCVPHPSVKSSNFLSYSFPSVFIINTCISLPMPAPCSLYPCHCPYYMELHILLILSWFLLHSVFPPFSPVFLRSSSLTLTWHLKLVSFKVTLTLDTWLRTSLLVPASSHFFGFHHLTSDETAQLLLLTGLCTLDTHESLPTFDLYSPYSLFQT